MRGRGVEVVVTLLHVLSVITLRPGQTKQPLLQNRITPIPQREGKGKPAPAVAESEQSILAPAIGPAACVVVGKGFPAIAMRRIILTHRAPLPLTEVGAPSLPGCGAGEVFGESGLFEIHVLEKVRLTTIAPPCARTRPTTRPGTVLHAGCGEASILI